MERDGINQHFEGKSTFFAFVDVPRISRELHTSATRKNDVDREREHENAAGKNLFGNNLKVNEHEN